VKLLKVEEHNYHIIYINDGENYNTYRRINETKWERYHMGEWSLIDEFFELEKVFNDRDITKTYTK